MKAEPLDGQIVKWLEKGLFYEALTGKGDYFIFDPFYRGQHDNLLVVSTIVRWAKAFNKIEHAREKLFDAVNKILESDIVTGLDILNCYLIVRKETKISLEMPLDKLLSSAIKGVNKIHTPTVEVTEKINSLLVTVSKQIVAFTKILELWNKKQGEMN